MYDLAFQLGTMLCMIFMYPVQTCHRSQTVADGGHKFIKRTSS
jgi:hypothetical protein